MLIDFRHKPTNDDLMMYNYLKYYKLPVTIVATKTGTTEAKSVCGRIILSQRNIFLSITLLIYGYFLAV